MTTTKTDAPPTEAQKAVEFLLGKMQMQAEDVAARLRVSLNSVIRWRRGVNPHPGHMQTLRDLVSDVKSNGTRPRGGGKSKRKAA